MKQSKGYRKKCGWCEKSFMGRKDASFCSVNCRVKSYKSETYVKRYQVLQEVLEVELGGLDKWDSKKIVSICVRAVRKWAKKADVQPIFERPIEEKTASQTLQEKKEAILRLKKPPSST